MMKLDAKWMRPMLLAVVLAGPIMAEGAETIYDESKVPDYRLPDPLLLSDGRPVKDGDQWRHERRPEILAMFASEMYGKAPQWNGPVRYELLSSGEVMEGKAVRKQVRIWLAPEGKEDGPSMDLLLYVPKERKGPVPAFLGLNFWGNHTVFEDTEILLPRSWVRNNESKGVVENRATEAGRGSDTESWPVEMIVDRGYALGTIYYGDIDPDYDDGFQNGIHPSFYKPGQDKPAADEWGSIAAWAWGLGRALDYLEREELVDAGRVAVMGHSRLGKAALWAGAMDRRFALVISNNSGCGGAALSRRGFGETVARINQSFPHWFCENFKKYNNNEAALPMDQHMLLALMAPRPVYVASAEEDRWADPRGEFLSVKHASPVFELLGLEGLGEAGMPEVHEPLMAGLGYHVRAGKHDVTDYDWEQYLAFADRTMK